MPFLLLLALPVAAAILWGRSSSSSSSFVDPARASAFARAIASTGAAPYAGIILKVAAELGLDPFLLVAIGSRESKWGAALRPQGPRGTGDFTPRNPASWGSAMPPDGGGWGRGLMQLDYALSKTVNWQDPEANIRAGAKTLLAKRAYLSATPRTPDVGLTAVAAKARGVEAGTYDDPRPLAGDVLLRASVAAYNAGEIPVLLSVAVDVDPDVTTSGKNYSADVLAMADRLRTLFGQ